MNATKLFWESVAKGQRAVTDDIVAKIVSGNSGIPMGSLLDLANVSCHVESMARELAVKSDVGNLFVGRECPVCGRVLPHGSGCPSCG